MVAATGFSHVCRMCWRWVVVKSPIPGCRMLSGPTFHNSLMNLFSKHFYVGFDGKNQKIFPSAVTLASTLIEAGCIDLVAIYPAIFVKGILGVNIKRFLSFGCFFSGEKFLIKKQDCSVSTTTESATNLLWFLKANMLYFLCQKTWFLELIGMYLRFLLTMILTLL